MDATYDLLVINGIVATAADVGSYDIAIKDGKIALLAPTGSLAGLAAQKTIDAQGGYVMPGGVDAHVHLEEPALFGGKGTSADTFESGSRSAIAGGTTTIVAFAPQEKHEPSLLNALKQTQQRASKACYSDYSFHLLISTHGQQGISEFPALREEGISSLKIYMTYEALQLRDSEILDILLAARTHSITTMIHAENGDVLNWMTNQLEANQLFAPKYHATSHPQLIEFEATNRAIVLSEVIDAPILIVHVSAPPAAKTIREAQTRGLPVYAETCPQYLFLTREDLDHPGFEGAKCVCSPPPRQKTDHDAIWNGLRNNTFTILSSDHCAFRYNDEETGKRSAISTEYPIGRFKYIPNGIPGVETRLPLVWNAGKLSPQKFVEVTSTNPARLYGLYPQKGALLPGVSDADLIIWYPSMSPFQLKNELLHHNVDYTPYEGYTMTQWPRYTILRGQVVYDRDNGGVVGEKTYGKFVKRGSSSLPGPRSKDAWNVEAF
ncbi:allantoinase, putative [Paecilomyces variotii No. 5]|uniref:Allantoinase, putative n=1 Tax=Byssochlamys spectabilis (strain No. 5 / NBRC 109023) TaxID=1356009 RepID=V5I5G0_BYSSN|nr:allantoinase, putative [Paecilomyces variotii No. 5]